MKRYLILICLTLLNTPVYADITEQYETYSFDSTAETGNEGTVNTEITTENGLVKAKVEIKENNSLAVPQTITVETTFSDDNHIETNITNENYSENSDEEDAELTKDGAETSNKDNTESSDEYIDEEDITYVDNYDYVCEGERIEDNEVEYSRPKNGKVYIIPYDVTCSKDRSKRLYCTDKKGTPVNGQLRKYREDKLIRVYAVSGGYLNGCTLYFPTQSNELMRSISYKNGLKDGKEIVWYEEDGAPIESETSYVKGKKEGLAKHYYNNGALLAQGIYINDKLYGKMEIYDKDGLAVFELEYVNDEIKKGSCLTRNGTSEDAKPYKKEIKEQHLIYITRGTKTPKNEVGKNDECAYGDIDDGEMEEDTYAYEED